MNIIVASLVGIVTIVPITMWRIDKRNKRRDEKKRIQRELEEEQRRIDEITSIYASKHDGETTHMYRMKEYVENLEKQIERERLRQEDIRIKAEKAEALRVDNLRRRKAAITALMIALSCSKADLTEDVIAERIQKDRDDEAEERKREKARIAKRKERERIENEMQRSRYDDDDDDYFGGGSSYGSSSSSSFGGGGFSGGGGASRGF